MKIKLFIVCSIMSLISKAQNPSFVTPIEGTYGKDFFIVNYVDYKTDSTNFKDLFCNTKTYEGHQGTDFVIRSFAQMDSGVNVLAVDEGEVIFVEDSLFDRNTESVKSRGFGNYIAIKHKNKIHTYYAHLKKNSAVVKVGEKVIPGQKIAQVGSSGNSSDPHLHFEVWYDSSNYIDPFGGPCGNEFSFWASELHYDTSFGIIEGGMHRDSFTLNSLRERKHRGISSPFDPNMNNQLSFWYQAKGLQKNDSIRVEWLDVGRSKTITEYRLAAQQDYWYYYDWYYLNMGQKFEGVFGVNLYINDKLELSTNAAYGIASVTNITPKPKLIQNKNYFILDGIEDASTVKVVSLSGQIMLQKEITESSRIFTDHLRSGFYVIHLLNRNQNWSYKLIIP